MFACDLDKLKVWNVENLDISVSFGCKEGGKDSSWVLEKKRPVEEVGDVKKDSVEEIVAGHLNYVRDGCSVSTGLVAEYHGFGRGWSGRRNRGFLNMSLLFLSPTLLILF